MEAKNALAARAVTIGLVIVANLDISGPIFDPTRSKSPRRAYVALPQSR